MSNRSVLKDFFETGDFPTQTEFADWLDSSPLWEKVSFTEASFQPEVTDTKVITLFSGDAGTTPLGVKIKHSASFTGGPVTFSAIKIEDSNGNILSDFFDVFQAPGDKIGQLTANFSLLNIPDQANPSDYTATLFVVDGVIDDLVAGAVEIWTLESPVV